MKTIPKTRVIALLGLLVLGGCKDKVTPLHHTPPQASFPMEEEVIAATVGQPVTLRAEIESGDKLTCGWYIDGTLEASTPELTYTFTSPGSYDVLFVVRNGAGKVEKTYSVTVSDVLKIHLSVGDSTRITRLQLQQLQAMAIVESGSEVAHQWLVDGTEKSTQAFFDTFALTDARVYTVTYNGHNSVGTHTQTFEVDVKERPLEIGFSNTDASVSTKQNVPVQITATVLYGGTGVQHEWRVDGAMVSTTDLFDYTFNGDGPYTVTYHGVNAKSETVDRAWTVTIIPSGVLFEDFENATELSVWWRRGENTPGITIEDNPKPEGINTSAKVLRDYVTGTGGTSGYFTLDTDKVLAGTGIDVTQFNGIRFKVYLAKNRYYPRVDIGGTKYAPVSNPKFMDEWEILEYRLPFNLDPSKIIQFRPLLIENGSNIASGAVSETNTRTVYIDDIEFFSYQ